MKISAVLASYNGEKYIAEQLESILNQTRSVDEVIINDDRSTDQTVAVVQSFLLQNSLLPSWKCAVNEKNLGFAENFRKAMDSASGDLIFLSDQDDLWVEDRVEKMASVMESNAEIGLLCTDFASFRDGTDELTGYYTECETVPQRLVLNRKSFFLRYPGCVMCVRRTFYDQAKEYWYQGWAHDDFLWSMAMLYGRCYSLRYCSLKRRFHEKQTSGQIGHSKEKRIRYLQGIQQSSAMLFSLTNDPAIQRLYEKIKITHQYRLELIQDKKMLRAIWLLPYLRYYFSAKSYLVELKIAWKG